MLDEIKGEVFMEKKKYPFSVFGERTHVYVVPKKNIRNFGTEWTKVLKRIIEALTEFPRNYFQRNPNDAGFSFDKRRFE